MNEAHRSRQRARLAAARNARVPVAKLRAPDRPAEDLHLVAENGVLELEL